MSVAKDIRLRVLAETRQFQQEMAKIPGTTEKQAAAAARNFAKNMIRAERPPAAAAQRSAARAAASIDSLGTQLGKHGSKVDRTLSRLSPMLATIDPQLATVATTAGDAAVGIGHLAKMGAVGVVAMGALAAVLVPLGAAYFTLKKQEEAATEKMEAMAASAKSAETVFGNLSDMTRTLSDEVRLMTGQIDDLGLALEKRQAQINTRFGTAITRTENYIESLKEKKAAMLADADGSKESEAAISRLNKQISRNIAILEGLRSTQQQQLGTAELLTEQTRENEQATQDSAEADRKKAENARIRAEQEAALATALSQVADVERTANLSGMSALEQKMFLYDEEIAKLDALDAKYGDQVDTSMARAALEKQLHRDVEKIRLDSIATIQRAEEKAHDKRMADIQEQRDAQIAALNATATVFGNLSSIALATAQKRAETDRDAAEKSLKTAKRLAIAEVGAATALGLINAVARNAGRPVATALSVAAVLTTAAVSLQQIDAMSLHIGGLIGAGTGTAHTQRARPAVGPGEQVYRNRVVLAEERVLSPEGTRNLGEEGARRLERGEAPLPPPPINTFKHWGLFAQDELRRGGRLTAAVGYGRSTGRRGY